MLERLRSRVDGLLSSYAKDILRVLSGNGLAQGIALASLPLLSRLYAPQDFAMQNLFIQFTSFGSVVLTWRYEFLIALPPTEDRARALERLVLWLAGAGTIVGTALVAAFRHELAALLGEPALADYLPLAVATSAVLSVGVALQNAAQRRQDYRSSSLSEVSGKLGYVGTAFAFGLLRSGPLGLLAASAGGALVKIATLRALRKASAGAAVTVGGMWAEARQHRKMAGSISLSHVLMALTGAIPSIFIARAFGNEALGQYALVVTTLFLPSALLGYSLGQVYYQRAAAAWANNGSFAHLWSSTVRTLLIVGTPVYLLVYLLAAPLYPRIFGANWSTAGHFAELLVPAAFFSLLTSPLDRGCLVVGAWRYVLGWHTFRVASTAVVAWWADARSWSVEQFLLGLGAQMSLCFLIDLYAGRHFATRVPAGAAREQASAP